MDLGALAYQRERCIRFPSTSGEEAFNFVMMTLVDFADPGLIILPPHRLIRGISKQTLAELMPKLKTFFDVEELPLRMPAVWTQVDDSLTETNEIKIVLFGPDTAHLFVLTLRDLATVSQMMPYFHSDLYKRLDVSIVDHVILEELLELSSKDEIKISYNYDRRDAVDAVLNQEYQLAFIVSPVKAETIKEIADAGDRMPHKSTYFYPKLPSGLVINRLV